MKRILPIVVVSLVPRWGHGEYREACLSGDMDACAREAKRLIEASEGKEGEERTALLREAEAVARAGCDQGHGPSCAWLAGAIAGQGRLEDTLVYAQRGCNVGHGFACFIAAANLWEQRRLEDASVYAEKGCNVGHGFACFIAAGILIKQDRPNDALKYARKGCETGSGPSCDLATVLLAYQKRQGEALPYAQKGCDLGDGGACGSAAGILWKQGRQEDAWPYAQKGCDLGEGGACGVVVGILGTQGRLEEAWPYAQKGCDLGEGGACGVAAGILGKQGRLEDAWPYAKKGCDLGDGQACGNAAAILMGQGRLEEAWPYAKKGCDLGDGLACGNAAGILMGQGRLEEAWPYAKKGCDLGGGGACSWALLIAVGRGDEAERHLPLLRRVCRIAGLCFQVQIRQTGKILVDPRGDELYYIIASGRSGEARGLFEALGPPASPEWLGGVLSAFFACTGEDSERCDQEVRKALETGGAEGWVRGLLAFLWARHHIEVGLGRGSWDAEAILRWLEEAEKDFRGAGLVGRAGEVRSERGRVLWYLGRYEESLRAFEAIEAGWRTELSGEALEWIQVLSPVAVWTPVVLRGLSLARLGYGGDALIACKGGDIWGHYCRAQGYEALARKGNGEEVRKAVEEARGEYEKAIEMINATLALWGDAAEKQEMTGSIYGVVLDSYLKFLLEYQDVLGDAGTRALYAIEVWKARAMFSETMLQEAAISAGARAEWMAFLKARGRYVNALARNSFIEAATAKAEMSEALATVRTRLGERAEFAVPPPEELMKRLCKWLPRGGVLLDYGMVGYPRREKMVLAAVRKERDGGCHADLFEGGGMDELDPEGNGIISKSWFGGSGFRSYAELESRRRMGLTPEEWEEVQGQLFGGAATWVMEGGSILAYSALGPVDFVNLEYVMMKRKDGSGYEPMYRRWGSVVRVGSVTVAASARGRAGGGKGGGTLSTLAYEMPDYERRAEPEVAARAVLAGEERILAAPVDRSGEGCFVEYEALGGLDSPTGEEVGVRKRKGSEASEHQLRRDLEEARWDVLSFLTHGRLIPEKCVKVMGIEGHMMRSVLALAGANEAREDRDPNTDGELTAAEVLGMPIEGLGVVVLAACESGRGGQAGWAGTLGFPQAFLRAGARAVLASVRPIPEGETIEIVKKFFRYLGKGLSPSEALRKAREEYGPGTLAGMDIVVYDHTPALEGGDEPRTRGSARDPRKDP